MNNNNKSIFKLKRSTPKIIREISGFCIANNLANDNFPSLAKCRMLGYELIKKTKNLGENNWQEQRKIIKEFNFWDNSNYSKNAIPDIDVQTCLSNFRDEFLIVIDREYDKSIDWSKSLLVRKVNPPLSAMKWIGHTKTDIKPTGRDYGLLFD